MRYDPETIAAFGNAINKYGSRFADGTFSNDSRTQKINDKMDLGIMDTLYKGDIYSSSNMHKGEVLGMLDLMMNTKQYREDFAKSDPERFNLYKLAHSEFMGELRDDYVSPAPKETKE